MDVIKLKFTIQELLILEDEMLFDYLKENNFYLTRNELTELAFARKVYYSTSDSKQNIIDSIVNEIALNKVNGFLHPNKKYGFINLHPLKEFTTVEKVEFINQYGKYLSETEFKSLIYDITGKQPKSYNELLKEMYVKLLKKTIKNNS